MLFSHAYPTKQAAQHAPPARLSARERMNLEAQRAEDNQASCRNSTAVPETSHQRDALPTQPTSREQGIPDSNGTDKTQGEDGAANEARQGSLDSESLMGMEGADGDGGDGGDSGDGGDGGGDDIPV